MIEVQHLTRIFRTYKKQPGFWGGVKGLVNRKYDETAAAKDVSFSIAEGEFVGFLGPNGAGKTTTLKMLSGLIFPTSGTARVAGFDPTKRENAYRRIFALVLGQKNQLWWDLPAMESFTLLRAIYGLDADEYKKTLDELVQLLGVADKLNVMVRELSLGERMKMELIAALIHRPKVLFLDEPTIGLDVTSQKKVREFLRVYNSGHRIITMLTSHYMQDIEELCERVIIIDHGRICYDGPLAAIIDRFATYKLVSLVFEGRAEARDFKAFGEILEETPETVQLKVPRAQVAETCREILGRHRVRDISVQEPPVEDVIRQVFGEADEERRKAG
jgi:ABC-2 type transport system ATP-binding protein